MEHAKYSIKDLEHFTQIKAHTIRIWEQRYGLLKPERSSTNIRFYNDNDLKKILNINLLYTAGWKISKIAKLSGNEIHEQAEKLIRSKDREGGPDLDKMIIAVLAFDHKVILEKLEKQFVEVGMIDLYESLILPTLVRIGELWQVNTIQVIHEHFFSGVLREFVITKQAQLPVNSSNRKAILFLHPNEEHELSLLIQRYVLTMNQFDVCYLGTKLPLEQLSTVFQQQRPTLLVTNYISKISERSLLLQIDLLRSMSNSTLIISGGQTKKYEKAIGNKTIVTYSLREFDQKVKQL